ncbi:hypothetical protein WS93_27955 [Burkholderia cepacia]|nr:hypothetical protein WS93_27955 [Burkholderia cepacia]
MRCVVVNLERVVDVKFLASLYVAHGVDEYTAIHFDSFTVRCARVIQPPCAVTAASTINNHAIRQAEQERVPVIVSMLVTLNR